jgi:nucleolar GTP-binding protein
MNFQTIPPVDSSKHLLDIAFKKAREKGKQKKLKGNWLQIIRQKEALKLDIIKAVLDAKLEKIGQTFPELEVLPRFYISLMKFTLDYSLLKKSLNSITWAREKISSFQGGYVRQIVKEKDRARIANLSKQFYGRISSIMKQINKNLLYLEDCRKVMKTFPDIKEAFTVCIYGFPNVGKTTLLNKLTGSKATTAAYAFTTTSINAGYMKINQHEVQVLDVPGTLAREETMNNIERQAELVLSELADVVIYVFDLSGETQFSLKKQEKLYKKLRGKKVFIYLSKLDLMEEIPEFSHKYYSIDEIKRDMVKLLK